MLSSYPRERKLPALMLGPEVPNVKGTLVFCIIPFVSRWYQSKLKPIWLFKNLASTPKSRVPTLSHFRDGAMAPGCETLCAIVPVLLTQALGIPFMIGK